MDLECYKGKNNCQGQLIFIGIPTVGKRKLREKKNKLLSKKPNAKNASQSKLSFCLTYQLNFCLRKVQNCDKSL